MAKLSSLAQFVALAATGIAWSSPDCKAVPGSPGWPTEIQWSGLNTSLSGRLIKPSPPGAVCHPTQVTFNAAECPAVQAEWLTAAWHTTNPVSSIRNNWNNDTCLPIATDPCSGEGYPIYVVNATCAEDVKAGVDFARENNIRLIVKGTGHDYIGRSSAPNSLSIWTHHITGLSFHDGFEPKGCGFSIDGAAITAAAGTQMLELDGQAHLRNLTIVSGGSGSVGVGGYLTGGGHGALSSTYGMGADQVLEIEMVTPGGDIVTVNECQNQDLFWAMRGGGGSTFGVMTSVTIKAFQSSAFHTVTALMATKPGTDAYWSVIANVLSQFPTLDEMGISAYSYIAPGFTSAALNITTPVDGFYGIFMLPGLHPENTSDSLTSAIKQLFNTATSSFPQQFETFTNTTSYPDFWSYFEPNYGPLNAGDDGVLGSRLLDGKALTGNLTALADAYRVASPVGNEISAFLVSGKGVHNAKPRGGSNAVNPAWRTAYIHSVLSVGWEPLNEQQKKNQEGNLTDVYIEGLRKLAPDMGAYVNEAYPDEPDWQHTFWGDNYERLLSIKKDYDLGNVLWCHPCVGSENWEVVDNVLCSK
ncbi:FAD-binding domain-containing protein [Mollisia scopiformis]|uniref:FAD-binding domain-containing protein n=1 Tax=Mollisia scopiformis TaxID=149040 RepID=A0A194WU46_MOLSC|nr:FAD-binding domain-containing protein [Mollisia scopiformis]KUJ11481.1 FAD-binding domain-containing protein [Mollisia scopiformis]